MKDFYIILYNIFLYKCNLRLIVISLSEFSAMCKIGIEDNWKKYADLAIQFPTKSILRPRNDHSPALELKFLVIIGNLSNLDRRRMLDILFISPGLEIYRLIILFNYNFRLNLWKGEMFDQIVCFCEPKPG